MRGAQSLIALIAEQSNRAFSAVLDALRAEVNELVASRDEWQATATTLQARMHEITDRLRRDKVKGLWAAQGWLVLRCDWSQHFKIDLY